MKTLSNKFDCIAPNKPARKISKLDRVVTLVMSQFQLVQKYRISWPVGLDLDLFVLETTNRMMLPSPIMMHASNTCENACRAIQFISDGTIVSVNDEIQIQIWEGLAS